MLNLIIDEIKKNGLNGVSAKSGLSTDKAMEICQQFLPEAMKEVSNVMQNPEKMSSIMGKVMSGEFTKFLSDDEKTFDDTAISKGEGLLNTLFDNFNLDEKVSEVANSTGESIDKIKIFLPLITSVLMGAVTKNAGSLLSGLGGGSDNPLGNLLSSDSTDDLLGNLSDLAGGLFKK